MNTKYEKSVSFCLIRRGNASREIKRAFVVHSQDQQLRYAPFATEFILRNNSMKLESQFIQENKGKIEWLGHRE